MQRFEFSDGKSNKFWEITVEGDSFTVRYGRVGTNGQTSTKTFRDAAKAQAEANKMIASKTKKGYQEVAVDAAAAANTGPAVTGNPQLEAAIFDDPDNLEAWGVYGDWLQEQGDPRGELVNLEVRLAAGADSALEARRDALLAEHTPAWLGKALGEALEMEIDEPVIELEWKFGFLRSVRLRSHWDYNGPDVVTNLRALLKLESFKFVHELKIGVTDLEGDTDFEKVTLPLSKVGKLRSIRRLVVGDFDAEEQEITWVKVGNVGRLWPVLPNLEYLMVRGGGIELGDVQHDKLVELHLETAGLPKSAVRSLARAKLPALETLEAWIGEEERSEEHGEHSDIDDLRPLLTGAGLPKVRALGLMNCDYQDDIALALTTAPIVDQLEVLDLSMGTMSDIGAAALVEHAAHFAKTKINLDENCIDEGMEARLRDAFGDRVEVGDQEPGEDEEDRYISVSE